MTRAKKIEEALEYLMGASADRVEVGASDILEVARERAAAALALPEEESARGVVATLEGFTVVGLPRGRFPLGTMVRVTVEGEESER